MASLKVQLFSARGSVSTSSRFTSVPATFLVVKADDTADHGMHPEWGELATRLHQDIEKWAKVIEPARISRQ